MRTRASSCLLLLLALAPAAALAQTYPTRPVMLVSPFPPGGSVSLVARIVADKMSETLGQSIVVENRGGAGGTIGARYVARSAPDGYTLLLGYTGTLAIGPTLYANAGFDPRRDFAPIGEIGSAPLMAVAHPSLPVHSIAELIAYAKANPGKVNFGSAGIGTVGQLAGELMNTMAGIELVHVPYKGTGPALTDLLGGHIPLMFTPIPTAHGQVQAGALRALAVTSAQRSSLLPDLPTVAESGLPGYEAALRYGLVAPAGTPRPIVERLNKELRTALASPDVRERLAADGAEVLPSTPEQYAADIDREETTWGKVVIKLGLKGE
ncbi:MAG TPA: tripartite tricarboxylate transporter substrate binding protein [Xanthobacteraceae bacterium]|nr:tripartite tricarboxylate transporter substrate binding protein [Xanthobacteraceae bacterium]